MVKLTVTSETDQSTIRQNRCGRNNVKNIPPRADVRTALVLRTLRRLQQLVRVGSNLDTVVQKRQLPFVRVYVCMYVRSTCVYIHIYMYIHIHTRMDVCMYVCMYVRTYVSIACVRYGYNACISTPPCT